MRKYAREVAFSLVFEYMFTKAFNEMELEQFDKNNLTDEDLDFIKKLYKGVVGEYSDLENRVGELSKGFKIDRVFKVDKAVLMMAIFELDNLDTPKSVVFDYPLKLHHTQTSNQSIFTHHTHQFKGQNAIVYLGAYAKD